VTVTLQPGTVVKFGQSSRLQTNGTLTATGTATDPVVFTSWRDDTAGGDTNNNGNSTGQASDWDGIQVSGDTARVSFDRVQVRFGDQMGVSTPVPGGVSILNSVFTDNQYGGLHVSTTGSTPRVQNNQFHRNGTGYPGLSVNSTAIDLGLLTGNTGSGNGFDGTMLSGTITQDGTWPNTPGWPVSIGSGYDPYYNATVTIPPT